MKPWNVVVDGRQYEIKARGGSLVVNGEKNKLKNLMSKKDGMWKIYELPLGPKKAEYYVNTWIGGAKLAMDGVDCATGKPFSALWAGWQRLWELWQLPLFPVMKAFRFR